MKRLRNMTWLLISALVTPALFAGEGVLEINHICAQQLGCFSGDTAGYPVTIDGTAGQSYRLTSDIIIPNVNTHGIAVDAPTIRIDLNGFAIIGVACLGATTNCTPGGINAGNGVDGSMQSLGLEVTNGKIVGMGSSGVSARAPHAKITNMHLNWNNFSGVRATPSALIADNSVFQNGSNGIYALGKSIIIDNLVSTNSALNSSGFGILGGSGSMIKGNVSFLNLANGIGANPGCSIVENVVDSNAGVGIVSSGDSMIVGNTVRGSGNSGIAANSGDLILRNTVADSALSGLSLVVDTVFKDNVLTGNGNQTVAGQINGGGINSGGNYCQGSVCF